MNHTRPRPSFAPGDSVAIITGQHAGGTGTVTDFPCLRGVPVHTDHIRYYDENQLILDLTREGVEALAADSYRPGALEHGRPLPRRPLRLTLGQVWAAQAAARRSLIDAPIAYVPVQHSDAVTISFGGVA